MESPRLHDVPCAHAGGLRRVDYWQFRRNVRECYEDLLAIEEEELQIAQCALDWRKGRASCVPFYDEMIAFKSCFTGVPIRRNAPPTPWTRVMVENSVNMLLQLLNEHRKRFDYNLRALYERLNSIRRTRPDTVFDFESHLKHAYSACQCFLCDTAEDAFHLGDMDRGDPLCYLCRQAKPMKQCNRFVPVAFMCESCYRRALRDGLCAFCLGHLDGDQQCIGRADWRQDKRRRLESSTVSLEEFHSV